MSEKTLLFHIHGMHCHSCTLLTEEEIRTIPSIVRVKSSLKTHTVEVIGNFGTQTTEEIMEIISKKIRPHGYTLSLEKESKQVNWADFKIAIPIALAFVVIFVILQKIGLINLVGAGAVTYPTAFIIGIIASLSTCMAVVGGLLLSMSATFAKEGDMIKPQLLFHGGRLVSFFVFGGIIGAIGSNFALNASGTFILGIIIGIVMLILGLNLLDVFHWSKRLQPSMPKFLSRHAFSVSKLNHRLTPLLVGIATFFLPCGFTQSMQIYTLSTGSFVSGALTMFVFALGTLPVLALLSFSSLTIGKSLKSGIFFKSAGLIVILFALFNIINSLAVIGIIPPLFNL